MSIIHLKSLENSITAAIKGIRSENLKSKIPDGKDANVYLKALMELLKIDAAKPNMCKLTGILLPTSKEKKE